MLTKCTLALIVSSHLVSESEVFMGGGGWDRLVSHVFRNNVENRGVMSGGRLRDCDHRSFVRVILSISSWGLAAKSWNKNCLQTWGVYLGLSSRRKSKQRESWRHFKKVIRTYWVRGACCWVAIEGLTNGQVMSGQQWECSRADRVSWACHVTLWLLWGLRSDHAWSIGIYWKAPSSNILQWESRDSRTLSRVTRALSILLPLVSSCNLVSGQHRNKPRSQIVRCGEKTCWNIEAFRNIETCLKPKVIIDWHIHHHKPLPSARETFKESGLALFQFPYLLPASVFIYQLPCIGVYLSLDDLAPAYLPAPLLATSSGHTDCL